MENICPNCQHIEPEGDTICSRCGSKLIPPRILTTNILYDDQEDERGVSRKPRLVPPSDAPISLNIIGTDHVIPLEGKDEFTIGRGRGQSGQPEVNLTPYLAFTYGISRLHASIKIRDSSIYIADLGSSNGTQINEEQITPHQDHLLKDGDVITLGRFQIQVMIPEE
jgi:pSer/pThr/pTyr-binding forkhead associated (FHA) protein